MIRLTDRPGPGLEPVLGCRIETLHDCYARLPGALALYRSGAGGLLCRFGGLLLLSGGADCREAQELLERTGAVRAECLAGALTLSGNWTPERHTVLRWAGPPSARCPDPVPEEGLRRVHALLCASDAEFARQAELLPWLSDVTLRMRRGRARVWLSGRAATAAVTAVGCGHALIASVACHPQRRREGMASRLVAEIAAGLAGEGLRPLVVAKDAALERFYERLGFTPSAVQETWKRQENT